MSKSSEIRNAWNKKNLYRKQVVLRIGKDDDLIDFVEGKLKEGDNISKIFKDALHALIEKEQ